MIVQHGMGGVRLEDGHLRRRVFVVDIGPIDIIVETEY